MAINQDKLHEFLGKAINDFGAVFNAALVRIGDKLGLYKALAGGPMSPAELAAKTGTDERYVREWLASQAAGGFSSARSASASTTRTCRTETSPRTTSSCTANASLSSRSYRSAQR